jgi:aspartate/methionine/tyrosine aminotransferase
VSFNAIVDNLAPYPMEELNRIKARLKAKGTPIYDFGTGDPHIPLWPPLLEATAAGLTPISQYPTIRGEPDLVEGIWDYLGRRFGVFDRERYDILPSNGSKEAIFHLPLCVVGRIGRKTILYPDPGYPVYRSGTLFAGGNPYPVSLTPETGYLLKPWLLPDAVIKDTAAVWINYPHNPTGAVADAGYYKELTEWAAQHDVLLLADDCYVDIYDAQATAPLSLVTYESLQTLCFYSLSKRSGLTGHRSGFIFGPKSLINPLAKARANFGVGTPQAMQKGAAVAWRDDGHVAARRELFTARMAQLGEVLCRHGMMDAIPEAAFYLWAKIPPQWGGDDVRFSLELATHGLITSPSSWLSEGMKGYVRFAMVPDEPEIGAATEILAKFLSAGPV